MPAIIKRLLAGRRFQFPIERILFLTVLHRLFDPGSDRAAERWCRRYELGDLKQLDLQHFYKTISSTTLNFGSHHLAAMTRTTCESAITSRL